MLNDEQKQTDKLERRAADSITAEELALIRKMLLAKTFIKIVIFPLLLAIVAVMEIGENLKAALEHVGF